MCQLPRVLRSSGTNPRIQGVGCIFIAISLYPSHLLREHKIVISELEAIVDPKRYIEHWRVRFNRQSIDNFFPRVEVSEDDPCHGMSL